MILWSFSTAGLREYALPAALERIAEAGFGAAELSSLPPHLDRLPDVAGVRGLRARLAHLNLRAATLHAPMERCALALPDEGERQHVVEWLAGYLRLAGELGAVGLVVHPLPDPGWLEGTVGDMFDWIAPALRRSLDALTPLAEAAGTRVLLENLPYTAPFPCRSVGELRTLAEAYPAKAVAITVDTGHAGVLGHSPECELRAAGERLAGTHLHDMDPSEPSDAHWPPGDGGLLWPAIVQALRESGYAGAWTFEVLRSRCGESPCERLSRCRKMAVEWEAVK